MISLFKLQKQSVLILGLIGLLIFWGLVPQIQNLKNNLQNLDQQLNLVFLKTKHPYKVKPVSALSTFKINLEKLLTENHIEYSTSISQDTLSCHISTLQVVEIISLLETLMNSSHIFISKLDITAQNDHYQVDILFLN